MAGRTVHAHACACCTCGETLMNRSDLECLKGGPYAVSRSVNATGTIAYDSPCGCFLCCRFHDDAARTPHRCQVLALARIALPSARLALLEGMDLARAMLCGNLHKSLDDLWRGHGRAVLKRLRLAVAARPGGLASMQSLRLRSAECHRRQQLQAANGTRLD